LNDPAPAGEAALAPALASRQNLSVRGRSDIPFVDGKSGKAVDALGAARILASSSGLGWADVHVELGRNGAWEVDDVAVPRHYLAMNTDDVPLTFEAKVGGSFRPTTLRPGEIWFCPAGESFSHRVAAPAGFALVTLEPAKLTRILEQGEPELRRTYAVAPPQLQHLVRALAAEAERGGPSGGLFLDALTTALAVQLAASFGAPAPLRPAPPRLGEDALRRVRQDIEARLAEAITVEQLGRIAGLGPAQFSRAFKATTRESPHQFIIRRRLEEAKRALEARDPDLLEVALRFGFADQAHFTRLFKRRYGLPPGRFVRTARREAPPRLTPTSGSR
jgi:AraC family transcriptional regulator